MANGRYTYTLDVENSRALKKLADFAKASDKATQRVNKDLKKQLQGNIKLKKSLETLKRQYEKGQKAAIKSRSAGVIDPAVIASQRNLKNRIQETTQAIEKGKRAAKDYRNQLSRIKNIPPPPGPAAPRRGFRGNTGRRAGFGRAVSGNNFGMSAGGGFAGGALASFGVKGLAVTAALLGTKALVDYGKQAAKAAAQLDKMRLALSNVAGEDNTRALEIVRTAVDDFNTPIMDATRAFTTLTAAGKAAGFNIEELGTTFRGLAAANKALGGDSEQLKGILLATTQVFSKGKVAAEELRGQIGERLPGAVTLFAQATGRTLKELDAAMEKGEVSLEDFQQFAELLLEKYADDAKVIASAPEEAGARLEVAMQDLNVTVGGELKTLGAAFQDFAANAAKALVDLFNLLGQVGAELESRMGGLPVEKLANANERLKRALSHRQSALSTIVSTDATPEQIKAAKMGLAISEQSVKEAQKLVDSFKLGPALPTKKLTAEDASISTTKKTKGSKGSTANPAADAARRLAKVQAAEARKLADLEFKLTSENFKNKLMLTQQAFTGEKAAQIGILNTYLLQNEALDIRAKKFTADIKKAESELAAAQARLEASKGGADAIRAQGGVDIAQAKLMGAQGRADTFNQNLPNLQEANGLASVFATSQPFRETTANLTQQIDLLRQKNRLVMEGFSGPALEAEMQKAELDQSALAIISAINEQKGAGNELDAASAERIRIITERNNEAKAAVDALTEAQRLNSGALQEYISSAQDYLTDVQGRIAEIAGAIESSISSAITGLISGTMSATEAFHNFFKSVGEAFLNMAAQMIAKLIIIKLLKSAIGMFGGGGGDALPTDSFAGVDNKILDSVVGPSPFAQGGIVTGPTNALIGEGGMNEAVVPLPNGRSIPVDMGKGGGAGSVQTNITVNVDQGGQTDTETSGDNANKLGKAIDSAVKRVIMDERRVGGLLYNGRR